MQKEYITKKTSSLSINVVATEVESLRKVVESTQTVRVYDDNCIGVAGQIGNANIENVEKDALENLALGISYPCDFTKDVNLSVDARKDIVDEDKFVQVAKSLLARLKKEVPDFLFSNKIQYFTSETEYKNTQNTTLSHKGNEMVLVLCVKSKSSANIMDFAYVADTDAYDEDKTFEDVKSLCEAYNNVLPWQEGKYPVIAEQDLYCGSYVAGNFNGESYATGASLFKDMLGKKIFNDKVTLAINNDLPNSTFFDAEGTVCDEQNGTLIKNGVFERVIANKKIAAQYGLPRLGGSMATYDTIPSGTARGIEFKNTAERIQDLIGNQKAIYVLDASGGDMTTSGDFATPCEVALLVENGKFVGRLPKLNIFGNVKEFLGDDFIGASDKGLLNYRTPLAVANMNVTLI